ncbi:CPBP family intramembrane glutamic endopeptidase [Salinimicrobium flavum]|uniref:CPBP family intramembrane glutamic endopeptidase n=1 Tax=Salinimicrobium flavum TaxID=1737065 RepID=A0ABW5IWC4_9FLAO
MHKLNRLKNLAKEHPVIIFYLVTFLISWGGLALLLGGPDQITAQPTKVPFLPLYLITVSGPCIAGILLIGIYHGTEGYRKFISRLFKYRVNIKWYAIALLTAPVTVFATLFVLWLFSPEFLPGIFTYGDSPVASSFGLDGSNKMTLVLFVLLIGLFNGFVEELGWTGFVTHELRWNHNFISTGLNIGVMWGLWHLLSNYTGSAVEAGNFPLPLYLGVLLFSFLPPFRILMTWVYAHTRSLLIAILMHASLDIFWILSMPNVLTGQQRVVWYLAWAVVLWMVVAVIKWDSNRKDRPKKRTFQ